MSGVQVPLGPRVGYQGFGYFVTKIRDKINLDLIRIFFFSAVSSLFLISFISLPFGAGDTAELVISSERFGECLSSGAYFGCNDLERFGLSPHLISVILFSMFNDVNATINSWSVLNFSLYLYFLWDVYKRFSNTNYMLLGALIFSPLTAYAVYSYTEMSFIVITYFLLIAIKKKNILLVIILGLIATAYRESSIILTLPLSIAVVFSNQKINIFELFKNLWPQVMGFILFNLFNFYKYNQFVNPEYQVGRVTDYKMLVSNFFGIWLSPSGGVIGYFWISIILIFVVNLLRLKGFRHSFEFYFILFAVLINILLLTNWYSPYGWATWGPRLFMPTLVLALLTVLIARNNYQDLNQYFLKLFFAISTYFASISLVGFLIFSDVFRQWLAEVVLKTEPCPEIFIWESQRELYTKCFIDMSWNLNSIPVLSIKNLLNLLLSGLENNVLLGFLSLVFMLSLFGYLFKMLKNNVK
jgi:hypothetical protein